MSPWPSGVPPVCGIEGSVPAESESIAKDLPGLPVQIGRRRVDGSGLHRKGGWWRSELNIPWQAGDAMRRGLGDILVGYRRQGREGTAFLRLGGGRKARAALEAAWKEYLLRTMERDGFLAGTTVLGTPSVSWSRPSDVAFALASNAFLVWVALSVAKPIVASWLGITVLFLATNSILVVDVFQRRWRAAVRMRWREWQLRRDGFLLTGNDCPEKVAIGEAMPDRRSMHPRGPLGFLTGGLALQSLLPALAERAGIKLEAKTSFPVLYGTVMVLAGFSAMGGVMSSWAAGALGGCVMASLAVLLDCADKAVALWRRPRLLSEGRAMLERLGW